MSHQTGITANESLRKMFGKCKEGKLRLLKVSIENEQLICAYSHAEEHSWEKDYDKFIFPLLEENIPCYIFYRLDKKTTLGYEWLLITWTPDSATVRQKMLYASTKATLKNDFGTAHIKEELHATVKTEASLSGYYQNKSQLAAPCPLTSREENLKELQKSEINTDISTETRQQTISGIKCPIENSAEQAIENLKRGQCNYIQFKINLEEEKIYLTKAETIITSQLPSYIPKEYARYHVYVFRHQQNDKVLEAILFIYSMPGYSCSVRERMMYSSCKAPFLETLQSKGLEIRKKLEIDDGSELTEEFLKEELYPQVEIKKTQFAKPKGPPNRGAKRVTKSQKIE